MEQKICRAKFLPAITGLCFALSAGAGPTIANKKFKFRIGVDGAVNRDCLFLNVNASSDWLKLGCNDEGRVTKEISLEVFTDAVNTFRLRMRSQPPNGSDRNVFDSADQANTAGYDYAVNQRTPRGIDLWINDNADRDFHDFRAMLEAPEGISFVVNSLITANYERDKLIDGCRGLGTGPEACAWSYYFSDRCLTQKCSKLVIYFAGGQMSCPDPQNKPQSYLARYADDGYVAVCARLFETQPTSGQFPFHKEATRVDLLMKTITADPAISQAWNGERLLISGVSHGSAAAVVAMARNDFDASNAYWRGSRVTGACFFDGVYHTADSLFRVSNARGGNACSIYPRAYGRYCAWSGNRYQPATWPLPGSCQTADTALDTVVGVPVSSFAIRHWKLIECGSSLEYCSLDLVSAPPQQQLCDRIQADASHRCTFGSFPFEPHNKCGASPATMDSCKSWFDQL